MDLINEGDDHMSQTWGTLKWCTHQARYIIDTMNMRSTKAPAATPYTQIFSFPSVEEQEQEEEEWEWEEAGQCFRSFAFGVVLILFGIGHFLRCKVKDFVLKC